MIPVEELVVCMSGEKVDGYKPGSHRTMERVDLSCELGGFMMEIFEWDCLPPNALAMLVGAGPCTRGTLNLRAGRNG